MKQRLFFFLLAILLPTILFFGCSRKPGEKLYYDALAEWDAGHLVRARTLFEKSIRRRIGRLENADAYNRLGLLLWEMDDITGAVNAFKESCRIDYAQQEVLCNLGVALSAQKDFSAAEQAFREAALLAPNDPRPLAFAGATYLQNQKWDAAVHNLRRALQRTPNNPRLQNALALAELHTVDVNIARERLQAVAKQNPPYVPALFNLAILFRDCLKDTEETKKYFTRYLDQSSEINAYTEQAQAELQRFDLDLSTKISFVAPNAPDRKAAEKIFQSALVHHKANQLEEAKEGYIQALEADDTYEQAFYNLGLIYYAQNKMVAAEEAFALAIQINPAFIGALYNGALVAHRLGRNEHAKSELEIILSRQPDYQPAVDLLTRINNQSTQGN